MKSYEWIIFILFISIFIFGCQNNKSAMGTGKIPADFYLSIERTPCFGTCPIFKVEISPDGKAAYKGKRFVENIGTYEKQLTSEQMQTLQDLMQTFQFSKFEESYDNPGISDLPSVIVVYQKNGIRKSVTFRTGGPDSFLELVKKLEATIGNEGYLMVK